MRGALAIVAALPAVALAAGGHHSVDDATILGAGQCEVEGWFTYSSARDHLLHAGGQCGVAGVEMALAAEPARVDGEASRGWQAQLKWAREWARGVQAGFSITPQWDGRAHPHFVGTTVSGLVTVQPAERWQLHANIGRDFYREGAQARSGVAVDWTTPERRWLIAAERYVENRTHFARAGLRWMASDDWTFDASRAQRLHGPRPSTWTIAAVRSIKR